LAFEKDFVDFNNDLALFAQNLSKVGMFFPQPAKKS